MRSFYRDAITGFEHDLKFYDGDLEDLVAKPDWQDIIIPTTGRAVIDEATDIVVPADIIVKYPPRGNTAKAERDSEACMRWLHGVWTQLRSAYSDIDPVRDFARNLFISGKACFKVVPDYTLWPVLPEEEENELRKDGDEALLKRTKEIKKAREGHLPLTVRSIPPACIMEDMTVSTRKLWVIEQYEMSNAEVRSLFSQEIEEFQSREFWISGSRLVSEIWTAKYVDSKGKVIEPRHYIMVDQAIVVDEESPFDDIPYVIKYSGMGRESYDGRPEIKAVGFFTDPVKSSLVAEARLVTQFSAIVSQYAYPIAFLPDEVDDNSVSFSPGAVNYIPKSLMDSLANMFVHVPIPDAEYLQSLNVVGGYVERGTVQRSVRGAPLPGADSAAQYSLQSNNAKLRMESTRQAVEQAMAQVSAMFLRWVDENDESVSVFVNDGKGQARLSLGKQNIRGNYTVNIIFQPNEDAVKERKLILANDAINKGGMSPFDAYTFAGFDNPLELIGRRLVWDLILSDPIKQYMAQELLKEYGIDADQVEMEGRMKDMQKQFMLRGAANQMQLGDAAGAEVQQQQQPQQPQMQQQGPTGPMGGQGGAPQQQMPAEVASMMGDMNAMASGVGP